MCYTPFIKLNDKAFSLIDSAETIIINGARFRGVPSRKDLFRLSGYDDLTINDDGYCTSPIELVDTFKDSNYLFFQGIKFYLFSICPCGKCQDCHYNKVSEFESRILMEAAAFPEMYFFTLTYDDAHLPSEGLRKSDMVAFNKRLRFRLAKEMNISVRLVYCGEYGPKTHRPHYHGLMFFSRIMTMPERLKLFDMFLHTRRYRKEHPRSPNIWPLGFRRDIQMCHNPGASARYLSKYVSKQYISKPGYDYHYTPEFIQTPRGCALGCTELSKYEDFVRRTTTGSLGISINGKVSTTRINRVIIDKFYPNLGHLVKGYKHLLSEFEVLYTELSNRNLLWLPNEIVHDAHFHVKYLDRVIYSLRQLNRIECMRRFAHSMSDVTLSETLEVVANRILHEFPDASAYYDLLLKKQNFYDRICNSELDKVTLRQQRANKVANRLRYVESKMYFNNNLE